jgi:hypothetical protein
VAGFDFLGAAFFLAVALGAAFFLAAAPALAFSPVVLLIAMV